ncbi:Eukaryotic translation initiation factor 3 subunit A [Trifolium repens]|nr:Eukaryotic translation initiation factor 3 subunit A [Trifolium repens]
MEKISVPEMGGIKGCDVLCFTRRGKFTFASSVPEVQLSQYVPALEKLATLRLLQQVSNMYQTMKIDNLAGLIPFFDFSVVEKIPVDAIKLKFLSMKVDHMKNVVIFCNTSLEDDGLKDHLASFAEQF